MPMGQPGEPGCPPVAARCAGRARRVAAGPGALVRIRPPIGAPGGLDIWRRRPGGHWLQEDGVDLLDVSAGGNVPGASPTGSGYLAPFSSQVRRETGLPASVVGFITAPELAEEIVRNGQPTWSFWVGRCCENPSGRWRPGIGRGRGMAVEQYRRAKS